MIITKESEIFQKLLKDVEYIKNAVVLSKYYVGCDPIEEREHTCIYKKGDWVIRIVDKDEDHHRIGRIFKITDVRGSVIEERYGITHWASSVRLASNDEIKNYLMQEAIRRGLVGWSKFKWDDEVAITTILPNLGTNYLPIEDALTVGVYETDARRCIYKNGKWAKPIFDTQCKELPKTVKELERLLKDLLSSYYGSDLFDERDKEVDYFLKAKGYK